jgi:hypothetical protein
MEFLILEQLRGGRRDVACWQIVLQKSFWGNGRKFSGTLTRVACGDMRDHIVSHKKRPRSFISALRSIAVAESAKNQLLRDFRRRSIFDFCNNICQKETSRRDHSITRRGSAAPPSSLGSLSSPRTYFSFANSWRCIARPLVACSEGCRRCR